MIVLLVLLIAACGALLASLVLLARAWAARRAAEAERDASRAAAEAIVIAAETERARAAQAGERAREETARAERAKDEFIATVSHELRTPLNAVLGWARLLRLGKLDAERTAHAVEVIERSASAQAQIVDDLLDVSRILRGDLRLDVRPLELASVVEAAVEAVRPMAEMRSIALRASILPHPGRVAGDPGRLQQVVWNLLANAIKFTSPGGRVEVRLEQEGEEVVVQVSDDGAGIDPAFAPHLFERFRQADSSSTRQHGGLGLGLSIVRRLVEAHGGAVAARSEGAGRGSVFTVRLPVTSMQGRRASAPSLPAQDGHGKPAPTLPGPRPAGTAPGEGAALLERLRILVVDDDEDSLEVLREILEGAGAQVATAVSVRAALAAFGERPPDVLLSDIGMPGEDGYALIRRVRALGPEEGGRVPAAALTAYTQAEDRIQAREAGFQVWLSKPIQPDDLTVAVARLAGRR
jgi:signal transduction histidine kinase/ActR/RegA family two-component response regulator